MEHTIEEIDLDKLYIYLQKTSKMEARTIMDYFLERKRCKDRGEFSSIKDLYEFVNTFWKCGLY